MNNFTKWGEKIKTLNFFLTLSRASASIPYFTMFQITKKNVYIMPSFSHKKGRTQKSAFQKDLASSLFTKKEYLRMYIFCYPQTENTDQLKIPVFCFQKEKKNEKMKAAKDVENSLSLLFCFSFIKFGHQTTG